MLPITLHLKPGREKSVRNRHPWVFEGAIAREEGPRDAAIGLLFDAAGRQVASGFYSRHSQIRLRAIAFGDQVADHALIRTRIDEALERRRTLISGNDTSALRLIHSEGDDLSGLIVDRYDDALVVEITAAGLDRMSDALLDALREATGVQHIYIKNDLPARRLERLDLSDRSIGDPSRERTILENGLRFIVQPGGGQKTGFFLDQRDNRLLVRSFAGGRKVLNLFSYTGGFGVYASAGGATVVDEVDVSADALALARRNHELNESAADVTLIEADAFEWVRELVGRGERYDLVVCDPPPFARSRGEVERAARGYKDINLQALKLIEPGGLLLTFTCSGHMDADLFQKIIFSAALDARRSVRILRRLGAGADHPVSIYCPEGEYLRGMMVEVR
ncbi:MAG TPA: class I SAM-dependent rRNA methyltransferase [Thermoanaerobaculia bacterium]|nr:class I SAM-dependent rRNA methyltransferase [Thermoanaerobaculia bacterium]